MKRSFGRGPEDPRPIKFQRQFTDTTPGSVLASFGRTQVLCTATAVDKVPKFLSGKRQGWVTAEYSMLPSSTGGGRKSRDRAGKVDGRSVEIQRLIGRSLRAVVDMKLLPEKTIWIDCDVLQADGGTRTTAISGAYVALFDLLRSFEERRLLREWPLTTELAAVSVGVVNGKTLCDLDYGEDSNADVDMNLVMTGDEKFVEVQGAAEGATFSRGQLDEMLEIGLGGARRIFAAQREALGIAGDA